MPSSVAALAAVVALLASPCMSAPEHKDKALRGAWWLSSTTRGGSSAAPWWLSSASRAAVDPWWLSYLPDAEAFVAKWGSRLAEMGATVNASINKSDADPVWREARELITEAALDTQSGRNFTKLCVQGMQAEYTTAACAESAFGSVLMNGTPADAYFCGSTTSGINWTRNWWGNYTPPVQQVCNASEGSAYNETGICGHWTTRQLVIATFLTIPHWRIDPVLINVPSLRCLLGLGNCDIHYCQNCPGRCGPKK